MLMLIRRGLLAATLLGAPSALFGTPFVTANEAGTTAVTTPESFKVNLEKDDFMQLVAGIKDEFLGEPFEGVFSERVEETVWFATLGIEGIEYSVKVDGLQVYPGHDRFHNHVAIKDLRVMLKKITFNKSGSWYCANLPISSGRGRILSYSELVATTPNQHLDLAIENAYLELTNENFFPGNPAECHVIWGFNWLIERATPWVLSKARGKIAEAINNMIVAKTREIGGTFDQTLQAKISIPVAVAPLPGFKAKFNLFPNQIAVSTDRVAVVAGTNLEIIRDTDTDDGVPEELPALDLGRTLPSYVGISAGFLTAALQEANTKGLFNIEVSARTLPEYGQYLVAELLGLFIPDATERFKGDAPVTFMFSKAKNAKVVVKEVDDAQIDLTIDGLVADVLVNGQPYQQLELTSAFRLRLNFDATTNKLELKAIGFDGLKAKGQFTERLNPPPSATGGFDELAFIELVKTLEGALLGETGKPLITMQVPAIKIGGRGLVVSTAGVRDDYVIVGGKVKPL